MMPARKLSILQRMPIFGGIREDILKLILSAAETVCLAKGEYFFREQDAGNAFYVLERGRVEVLKTWHGAEHVLLGLGAGDCFGEMSMIDLGPRTASVLAREDCEAIKLTNGSILKVYRSDVEQFTMIQMNMSREVCRRLRRTDELLFEQYVKALAEQLNPAQPPLFS